jgi:hypothetical protein
MSDVPADWRGQLDLRKELARIDRDRAETQKLIAEATKFKRERWVVPLTVLGALLAAIVARLPEILHAAGIGH